MLRENKVERLFLPPAVLHWLADSINEQAPLLHLNEIFAAGEALTVTESLADFLKSPSAMSAMESLWPYRNTCCDSLSGDATK